ncbi:MAG: hypothetical protein ACOYON_07905 [Fimbriimonas sp.]
MEIASDDFAWPGGTNPPWIEDHDDVGWSFRMIYVTALALAIAVPASTPFSIPPGFALKSESVTAGLREWKLTSRNASIHVTSSDQLPEPDTLENTLAKMQEKRPEQVKPIHGSNTQGWIWWLDARRRGGLRKFLMSGYVKGKSHCLFVDWESTGLPSVLDYAAFERMIRSFQFPN